MYVHRLNFFITVYMCVVWPCYSFVDGLSKKCINVYIKKRRKKKKKVKVINHDCLPILIMVIFKCYFSREHIALLFF